MIHSSIQIDITKFKYHRMIYIINRHEYQKEIEEGLCHKSIATVQL